jgi:uncharacterized membrane protein YccC
MNSYSDPQPTHGRFAAPYVETPEPPKTWRDHVDDAKEYIRDAERGEAQDAAAQRRIRRNAIQEAIDRLSLAMAELP